MTSIKLKFKPSTNPDKEGALVFQLIQNRSVRRIKSKYRIFGNEWDKAAGRIIMPQPDSPRYSLLSIIRSNTEWSLKELEKISMKLESSGHGCNIDDVIREFANSGETECGSVFNFIRAQALHRRQIGKTRSGETYQATLNSFMRFRKGIDLTFDMMDSKLVEFYEANLRAKGLSRNTTSFYMRILRTNYNMAVEKGLTQDTHPFRHVYCGIDKAAKRSITLAEIKKIKELDLSRREALNFARDMFIFSFCTRGMSFIDMAYLKKNDLKNGYLTYRRRKTGQLLTIEWTRHMQEILDRYKPNPTQYLLPIIMRENGLERRQYQNQMARVNRNLKKISSLARLSVPLSLYYSRHSWATIARGKEIPLSVISEGLGHDSETTTQIYLDSIKSHEVDKANREILKDL